MCTSKAKVELHFLFDVSQVSSTVERYVWLCYVNKRIKRVLPIAFQQKCLLHVYAYGVDPWCEKFAKNQRQMIWY